MTKVKCGDKTQILLNSSNTHVRPVLYAGVNSTISSSSTSSTQLQVIMIPVEYSAIRIGMPLVGGSGNMIDMTAIISATDDIGDLEYDNTTATKKFIVPQFEGAEKNSVSQLGWKDVTWNGGASSVSATDPGAGNVLTVWSDLIDVQARSLDVDIPGTYDGYFPLMIRMHHGTGQITLTSGADGQLDDLYFTDSNPSIVLNASRSGDSVTTPSNWGSVNTPNYSASSNLGVLIEAYTAQDNISVMTIGDSRLATASSSESSTGYRTLQWRIERDAVAADIPFKFLPSSQGGETTTTYFQRSQDILTSGNIQPTATIYLIYSINNGQPDDAEMADVKAKCLRHIDKCAQLGTIPMLMTSFPTGGGFTVDEMANLVDLDAFATNTGLPMLSPLAIYGDSTGDWLPGFNEDTNHMTPAGYDDLAARWLTVIQDNL